MDFETIKSYLVSLGFSVDNASLTKFQTSLKDLSKQVESHTAGIAKNYTTAAGLIVGAIVSITTATVGLMDKIAQSDMGYQIFAMRMYMNVDAAKKLKISLDSLGYSLNEIARNPELRGRLGELVTLQNTMAANLPKNAEAQLRYLRDIRFEFTKLKVEATYGAQMVVHNLFKILGFDIKDTHDAMHKFNDWIVKNMPEITMKIAEFIKPIIVTFKDLFRYGKEMVTFWERIWGALGKGGRAVIIFAGIVAVAFGMAGPWGQAMLVISTFILLIDDFYGYIDGKKSSPTLAPIWRVLAPVFKDIRDAIENAAKAFDYLIEKILGADNAISKFLKKHSILAGIGKVAATGAELVARNVDVVSAKIQGKSKEEIAKKDLHFWQTVKRIWSDDDAAGGEDQDKDKGDKGQDKGSSAPGGEHPYITAAKNVAGKTKLPWQFIFAQWYHETGGFKNRGTKELNNLAGIRIPGKNEYQKFNSIEAFSDYYADLLMSKRYRGAGVLAAKTPEEFAGALKKGGYYEDTTEHYTAGLKRGIDAIQQGQQVYADASGYNYQSMGGGNYNVSTNIGSVVVHVDKTNASPQDIYNATIKAIQDATNKKNQRQLRTVAGAYK